MLALNVDALQTDVAAWSGVCLLRSGRYVSLPYSGGLFADPAAVPPRQYRALIPIMIFLGMRIHPLAAVVADAREFDFHHPRRKVSGPDSPRGQVSLRGEPYA